MLPDVLKEPWSLTVQLHPVTYVCKQSFEELTRQQRRSDGEELEGRRVAVVGVGHCRQRQLRVLAVTRQLTLQLDHGGLELLALGVPEELPARIALLGNAVDRQVMPGVSELVTELEHAGLVAAEEGPSARFHVIRVLMVGNSAEELHSF